jgi:uncharacterized spore protein YtfJ
MDPHDAIKGVREALSARQVFGQPVERDGVTVIPAAMVIGGGGGGGSEGGADAIPSGGGAGYGIFARPVGAFEIGTGGKVRWHPAVDRTWLIVAAVPVLVALLKLLQAKRRG